MSVEFLIDCLMSFRRELMQLMSQPSSCFRSPLWYDTALFLLPLVIGYAYTSLTFVLISFSGRCSCGIGKIWKVFSQSLKDQKSLRVCVELDRLCVHSLVT